MDSIATDAIVSRGGFLQRRERAGLRACLRARGGWFCHEAAFRGRNDHRAHAHRRVAEEFGDRARGRFLRGVRHFIAEDKKGSGSAAPAARRPYLGYFVPSITNRFWMRPSAYK